MVEAGPPHVPDGVVAWWEVRGLAQGRVASTQQAGRARGAASSGWGLWVPAPWGRALTCGPSPSQTPRGSQTQPRWRRFARRSTRPWRRTANTSTLSSQEGETRPQPPPRRTSGSGAAPPLPPALQTRLWVRRQLPSSTQGSRGPRCSLASSGRVLTVPCSPSRQTGPVLARSRHA